MESIHYDVMMNHVVKVLNPVKKCDTSEIKKPEVVFTYEFQNLLIILLQVMTEKDKTYVNALSEIDKVTVLIDEEHRSSS